MPEDEPTLAVPVSPQRDHVTGAPAAPVTLVEYGDFECPYCGQAYRAVKQLLAAFPDQIRFAFRNFPLSQIHPHAAHAAEAAEAAAAQGRFWEMHDQLYQHQKALDDEDLLAYAADLGLDPDRFAADLAQDSLAARVRDDFMGGVRSGVNGTPTFFINGRRHNGAYDLQSLSEAITTAMALPPDAEPGRHHHRHSR